MGDLQLVPKGKYSMTLEEVDTQGSVISMKFSNMRKEERMTTISQLPSWVKYVGSVALGFAAGMAFVSFVLAGAS